MSSILSKRASARKPAPSKKKKRQNQEIDEPESTTRPTKRTNGFAYLGNDQEELEELCHNLAIVADQRWRSPQSSTTGGQKTTTELGRLNSQVSGSQEKSSSRKYVKKNPKVLSKPVPRNPLNIKDHPKRSQPQLVTPTNPEVSPPRMGRQPSEHPFALSRSNDVEFSYVNILKRLKKSAAQNDVELEVLPHDSSIVFYPPDYDTESMWSQVDFREITNLHGNVDVNYHGSGNWVFTETKGEAAKEAVFQSRMSSRCIVGRSAGKTRYVVSMAVPMGESSKQASGSGCRQSTKAGRGLRAGGNHEHGTKEDFGEGARKEIGHSQNHESANEPPTTTSSRAEAEAEILRSDQFYNKAVIGAMQTRGPVEPMDDIEWKAGMEAIEDFEFNW